MIRLLINLEISQRDVLREYNANITNESMPCDIKGFVFCYRGINNIFINKNLSNYKKKNVILHELAHLELNHIYQKKECLNFNINNVEDEADEYINNIKLI